VRYVIEVPERENVVPVPDAALTVTVSLFVPTVVGLKVTEFTVQKLPEAMVVPAVQVPKPTVKSVASEFENGVELKMTAPPEADRATEPVHALLEPTFVAGQVKEPETPNEP
jgi:hypothetical protein